jgi:alginate O-acetyltransferase complex protein AlgJ
MLTRDQIVSVYRQVLEREPSEEEIRAQLATVPSLDSLLQVALESEEYAARLRRRGMNAAQSPAMPNIFHPDLAEWGLQPGVRSADEIAIVGHEGWLFLCGGTNANLDQYVGEAQVEPDWLAKWQEAVRRRETVARELGLATALLVVPDKLAVYEEHYPEELPRVGPRPVERLRADAELPIFYPLDDLRAAAASGEEVYMRTDTHLTFRGNQLLAASVMGALGVQEQPDLSSLPLRAYPVSGDLGAKFDPPIVGIVREPGSLGDAQIVEDNRAEIAAVDGHIGTRRVFRNDRAPDPRLAVVFGDSFGFSAPNYQGVSWFMAQVFREVHFIWIPFGWDTDYIREASAEVVLVQGAERFVARAPHAEVNASSLAEETLRRKQPAGIESVSD